MKIKLDSDDKLPLNKTIEIHSIMIVLKAAFHETDKYHSEAFLNGCLFKL